MENENEKNNVTMKKALQLIAFAVLLYQGVQHFAVVLDAIGFVWGLLYPFILGGAMAFVLNIPMKFMEEKIFDRIFSKNRKAGQKLVRPLSLVCAVLFVLMLVLTVALVVIPELGATAVSIGKQIEQNLPKLQQWLAVNFHEDSPVVQWINTLDIQPEKLMETLGNTLKNGVDNILSSTFSLTLGIVNTATNVGIGFIFGCYILIQKENLSRQVKKALRAVVPRAGYKRALYVMELTGKTFASFITCQCIEAVILGGMFFVTMTVLRFPYAMLVGVLIAFTALIPIFGAIIGCAVGFLLILMVNPMQALAFLLLFFVLQQLEGNLIYPHVVGNSVGLPSIWVLVAVSVGGSLMGVMGMLVFIPLVSVIYALFRAWVNKRLEKQSKPQKESAEF